jgi:hypothetical protein
MLAPIRASGEAGAEALFLTGQNAAEEAHGGSRVPAIDVPLRGPEFSAAAMDAQVGGAPFRGIEFLDLDAHGAERIDRGKTVLTGEEPLDFAGAVGEGGHHDGPVGDTLVSGDAEFHPDGPAPFDLEF